MSLSAEQLLSFEIETDTCYGTRTLEIGQQLNLIPDIEVNDEVHHESRLGVTTHPSSGKIASYLQFIYASILFGLMSFYIPSISPITDVLENEFDTSLYEIGLLSSSYFLFKLVWQIPFGILLQKYSYHTLQLFVSISLTLLYGAFGLSNSIEIAIAIRSIIGMLSAPIWLILIASTAHNFGNNMVQVLISIAGLFAYFTAFAGLSISGFIFQRYQIWRETYYMLAFINGVIALSIFGSMIIKLQQNHQENSKKNSQKNSEKSKIILSQYSTTLQTIPTFGFIGSHQLSTETDPTTTKNKRGTLISTFANYLNWVLGFYVFAMWTVFEVLFRLWLVPYLMIKFDFSRTEASIASGIGTLSTGFGMLLFGFLAYRYKKRKIFLFISNVLISSVFIIMYLDRKWINHYIIFGVIILSGLGTGTLGIAVVLAREYNVSAQCQETATGFINTFSIASGLIPQYLVGLLLNYHRINIRHDIDKQHYEVSDYQYAFSCIIPACIVITVITSYTLKETNGKNF